MPHVPRRAQGYTRGLYVLKPDTATWPVDYAFFDTQGNVFPIDAKRQRDQYDAMLARFAGSAEYECVADEAGYKLYKRKEPGPRDPSNAE